MNTRLFLFLLSLFGTSVLSGQNIGINNNGSAPSALLDVYKNAPSANEILFKVGASTGINRFTIDEDGDMYVAGGSILTGSLKQGGSEIGGFGIETATSIYAGDFISALGGIHVGGVTDPGTNNLIVAGKVGIGTTPISGAVLDVEGATYIGASTTNAVRIEDGIIRMQDNVDAGRSLEYRGTKLSIGAINGVTSSATATGLLNVGGFGNGQELVRLRTNNNTGYISMSQATVSSFNMSFVQAGTTQLYLKNDGKIGVGNANPSYPLDVTGTAHVDGLNVNGNYSLPTTAPASPTTMFIRGDGTWATASGADGNGIYDGSGSLTGATIVTQGASDLTFNLNGTGDFKILDNGNSTYPIMQAFDNGNLGIGTNSSNAHFHIHVENYDDPDNLFLISGGGAIGDAFSVNEVGAVTIDDLSGTGTRLVRTNSSGVLESLAAGTSSQYLRGDGVWAAVSGDGDGIYDGNGSLPVAGSQVTVGTGSMIYNLSSTGDFDIRDAGVSRFFVQDNGNVGIGSSTTNEQLTVAGTISMQEQASNETATSGYGKIYAKTDGKVYYRNDGGNNYDLTQGADDLGNHTATTTLNMGFQSISNANDLSLIGGISAGGSYGAPGNVLKTNGGTVSWGSVDDAIGSVTYIGTTLTIYQNDGTPHTVTISGGDNLGDHSATQDLQMNQYSIRNPQYITNTAPLAIQGGSGSDYGSIGLAQVSGGPLHMISGGNIEMMPASLVNITGNLNITGTISKGGGTFKIDHPMDPENKFLYHSFVESPDMMNIYNGNVILNNNGVAIVTLPDYFGALNIDFRYQLTCIGAHADVYISKKVSGNTFEIAGGLPGMEVSWQVTGIRNDKYAQENRVKVEVEKSPEEKGYYLHPTAFGLPKTRGVDYARINNTLKSQNLETINELMQNESSYIQRKKEDELDQGSINKLRKLNLYRTVFGIK